MPNGKEALTSEVGGAFLERRALPGERDDRAFSTSLYYYYTYGLHIASQLQIPELQVAEFCHKPDVMILAGDIKESLEDFHALTPCLQLSEDRFQVIVDGIARYRIEHGKRIIIDRRGLLEENIAPAPGDVRLFLLGTAFGVLLHQRRWLPLHVSALKTPSGVWAFTGHSGAGKSTLGAWLHYAQALPMVSDDVAVIKPQDETPYIYPGPPRLKLWKDALAALSIDRRGLVRDLMRADKYHLMLEDGFQVEPQPLRALVLLERAEEGESACLELVTGVAAFQTLMSAIYRPEILQRMNSPRLLHDIARLAEQIHIYRFRRPWSLEDMNSSIEPLVDHMMKGGPDD